MTTPRSVESPAALRDALDAHSTTTAGDTCACGWVAVRAYFPLPVPRHAWADHRYQAVLTALSGSTPQPATSPASRLEQQIAAALEYLDDRDRLLWTVYDYRRPDADGHAPSLTPAGFARAIAETIADQAPETKA